MVQPRYLTNSTTGVLLAVPGVPVDYYRVLYHRSSHRCTAGASTLVRMAEPANENIDIEVTIFEAQDCVGGRLKTDSSTFQMTNKEKDRKTDKYSIRTVI